MKKLLININNYQQNMNKKNNNILMYYLNN